MVLLSGQSQRERQAMTMDIDHAGRDLAGASETGEGHSSAEHACPRVT